MKVLIIEDEVDKLKELREVIDDYFDDLEVVFEVCRTFKEVDVKLYRSSFDLIVTDLYLPLRDDEEPIDCTDELLEALEESGQNKETTIVAISKVDVAVTSNQSAFIKAGIFLLSYTDRDHWKSCLKVCMQRVNFSVSKDFLIITALEEEAEAYRSVKDESFHFGSSRSNQGLNYREVSIGPYSGICITQPRMGLVEASIVAARAIGLFAPKLVCMSGICAGFSNNSKLGQIVVSDICWEHQAGKWSKDDFEVSHYQEALENDVKVEIKQLISDKGAMKDLDEGFIVGNWEKPNDIAVVAPTVSGSAVIASDNKLNPIKGQHRKLTALDMEIFGVFRAASLSSPAVRCFAAKTVVDFADEKKNDDLHKVGAVLSARFTVKAIERILTSSSN